ncbi:hypothetical protein SAMN02745131_00266 [Flavisolibacter ginsengisoli DSM 18119]|jgi:hypothetical protein|uniref:Uncharacterized protein n=1 Tax=Flavisolibacter ginsengisoli DSM 18119 TaxID=1121884 RepID=A0A1M4SXI3_9BACT|nr:hypothetical protein SAMN02745131_00266 [Flavisolibacter ginsengisoli DSM 18119]
MKTGQQVKKLNDQCKMKYGNGKIRLISLMVDKLTMRGLLVKSFKS